VVVFGEDVSCWCSFGGTSASFLSSFFGREK
jgi:hypothetical protein